MTNPWFEAALSGLWGWTEGVAWVIKSCFMRSAVACERITHTLDHRASMRWGSRQGTPCAYHIFDGPFLPCTAAFTILKGKQAIK